MYSTWFHQINSLARQTPEILDFLTPEKLLTRDFAEEEGYLHESADTCRIAYQPAGLKRL